DTSWAALFVETQNDLCVARGAKAVAALCEPIAQTSVIVHLAVQDQVHASIVAAHRLTAGIREIDNCEPSVPECHGPLHRRGPERQHAAAVRPAVTEPVDHG